MWYISQHAADTCPLCRSRYMAPEVYRHEPYNNKVDVYSFSMIAFQLLEGYPPFWTMDPIQAARRAALEGFRPEWGKANRWGPGTGALGCCCILLWHATHPCITCMHCPLGLTVHCATGPAQESQCFESMHACWHQ
jgi:serine/threonine protein kinase